nr:Holliday junction branch migration protein RuvA [Epidermidibacterium keratini]
MVRSLGTSSTVIEVGGVGMLVHAAPGTLARLSVGQVGSLSTSLVVREDSLTLYGFADDEERSLFELLQSANGVGPKVAQAVLATLPPREVRRAIATGDHVALTQVPGIGKKGAERLVIDLKDKIGLLADNSAGGIDSPVAPAAPWRDQLVGALVGLGWSGKEAEDAAEAVAPQADEALAEGRPVEVAPLLRAALRSLSK